MMYIVESRLCIVHIFLQICKNMGFYHAFYHIITWKPCILMIRRDDIIIHSAPLIHLFLPWLTADNKSNHPSPDWLHSTSSQDPIEHHLFMEDATEQTRIITRRLCVYMCTRVRVFSSLGPRSSTFHMHGALRHRSQRSTAGRPWSDSHAMSAASSVTGVQIMLVF